MKPGRRTKFRAALDATKEQPQTVCDGLVQWQILSYTLIYAIRCNVRRKMTAGFQLISVIHFVLLLGQSYLIKFSILL